MPGEENPALGVRGLRLSFGNPGLMDRQLDGIKLAAERAGTETWVMAPMVATVAEAADFAEQGARPRAQARRDGRDPERRAARAPDARGRRLPLHRHQRPDAVHDGRRPDGHRPRAPHRPVAAGRPAADRDHRRGGQAGRQAGRGLRRGRGRPDARLRARRDGDHVAVDGRPRRTPRRRPARRASRWTPARPRPRPRSAPATRWPPATPSAGLLVVDR